jgi:Flp pilus assembly protein TadG
MSQLRSFVRDEQGAVILETALMLTILLMLMFGIFDIGRVMYTVNSLTSAAREGARAGAVMNSSCSTFPADVKAIVISRFKKFGGSDLVAANITISSGGTTLTNTCPASGSGSVKVAVQYPFSWLTPLPKLIGWGSSPTKNLTVTAEYKYEL